METTPRTPASRPNLVSVGTIIWLSSELMFFAALFAMYFTVRSVVKGSGQPWPGAHLNIALGSTNTTVLLLSSVTCQMGVFAVERGQISRTRSLLHPMSWGLREWYVLTFFMGLYFDLGQGYEYMDLVTKQHLTVSSSAYGSVFYIPTGFHGLHVLGGLLAWGRTTVKVLRGAEAAKVRLSVELCTVSWHYLLVVWLVLFAVLSHTHP